MPRRFGKDEDDDRLMELLERLSPEERRRLAELLASAEDEEDDDQPPAFSGRPRRGGGMDPINRVAADAADPVARFQAIRAAAAECADLIGPGADLAYDSAEAVYRAALGRMGIDSAAGIRDLVALRAIYRAARQRRRQAGAPAVAYDERAERGFARRHPDAAAVEVLG
ncbi:MAG TPA: hypothetical protein VFA12_10130 [Stellaceae bacterium]|nr:hypothetical protein [Stellaceae bacterium]